ncbi:MAG: hypothetical protein ACTSQI_15500 [Candidatus Helarchaeota archaeon]
MDNGNDVKKNIAVMDDIFGVKKIQKYGKLLEDKENINKEILLFHCYSNLSLGV